MKAHNMDAPALTGIRMRRMGEKDGDKDVVVLDVEPTVCPPTVWRKANLPTEQCGAHEVVVFPREFSRSWRHRFSMDR